jgi:hypothetical protein
MSYPYLGGPREDGQPPSAIDPITGKRSYRDECEEEPTQSAVRMPLPKATRSGASSAEPWTRR